MKNELIGLITTVLGILTCSGLAIAATTVDSVWSGSGSFDTHFVAGNDAHSDFWTGGSVIGGEFHAVDSDDNPYGYQVDTVASNVKASVSGGGFLEFQNTRDDSKVSMYGSAGQQTYTYIITDDGSAELAWYTWTNYAAMKDCQYSKPTTTNGKNFEASGSSYSITHQVTDSSNDGAAVVAYGSGSAKIKLQGESAGGVNSEFNMGSLDICGDGCAWKNNYATFSGTGVGDFEVHSWADNGITVGCPGSGCTGSWSIPGDGTGNSAQYDLHVQYAGTWNYQDFGVRGN